MNYRLSIAGIAMAVMVTVGTTYAQEELSTEQKEKLTNIDIEFSSKGSEIENKIQQKMMELGAELNREGRLDSEKSAKKSAKKVDATVRELGDLYGQYIKTKVKFLLEAKNVLTKEQKLYLLQQLQPQDQDMVLYNSASYMKVDLVDLPLDLSIDQRKKLITLFASHLKKGIDIRRDMDLVLLDLESALLSDEVSTKKVDSLITKLASLVGKKIDNRVDYFLDAKNVLTLDQKRTLIKMLDLN